ncbi:UPF0481 protein At3g47200-like [Prosopis cineraria]|uniref:UPF0481 protein At3g47200-like n=1 Tax=Prosopis cineraria TaxID=364024 RepID=UPI002410A0CE|nr:UPF0481 protein At3g47200-like [Prosopis cineraria]
MALDVNKIANEIMQHINNVRVDVEPSPKQASIFKVPEDLRSGSEDAYTPSLISIGPIHHDKEKLKPMEGEKSKYLKYFLQRRSSEGQVQHYLEIYLAMIYLKEDEIRSYYSDTFPMDKAEFVRMILFDAIFITELFLRKQKGHEFHDDPLFTRTRIKKTIERDLLLIENQIPYFVLDDLYHLIPWNTSEGHSSFMELSRNYFKRYDPFPHKSITDINKGNMLKQGWEKPNHFTDLIRHLFVPQDLCRDDDLAPIIKTATRLRKAGITFESVSERCLLDIRFEKNAVTNCLSWFLCCSRCLRARMQIPKLVVDGSTESIIRNLMAFEQCYYPNHHYVCNYVALIAYLIHNEQDVNVLVEDEVIEHEMGSDEKLASLITTLCKNIVINSSCYASLSKKMDEYYHNPFNNNCAALRLVYFRNLWRSIGTVVGIVVFIIFGFVAFYKNMKDLLKH